MAVAGFDRLYLERLLGKQLSQKDIEERIPMLGCPFEGEEEGKLFFEVFPNRPDMLGAEGFARAVKTFLGITRGLKEYAASKPAIKLFVDSSVQAIRPHIAAAVVRDAKLTGSAVESLIQLQEKIDETMGRRRKKVAIGLHDMEKVTPPFTYKAAGQNEISFIPLDFSDRMTPAEILERHPKGRLYGGILRGSKTCPVIIDSKGQVLSFPPIINSELTRVTGSTKTLFIDITGQHEKPLNEALNIIVTSLADAGAKIEAVDVMGKRCPDLSPRRIKVSPSYANSLLGTDLSEKQMAALAGKMGYGYDSSILVPAYRADIMHQIDIVEDIAIAHGYENFKPAIPRVPGMASRLAESEFRAFCGRLMTGLGFQEIQSMYLVNEEDAFKKMRITLPTNICIISNSVSNECTICRASLLQGLVKALSQNRHNTYPQKLFEIGEVFAVDKNKETGAENPLRLAAALSDSLAGYEKLAAVLASFLSGLGINFELKPAKHPSFLEGRTASIIISGSSVGIIGEIHPEVLQSWNLECASIALELDLDAVSQMLKG